MAIQPFGLHDNLMLVGGVIASGGCIVSRTMPPWALPGSSRYLARGNGRPRWVKYQGAFLFLDASLAVDGHG